MQRTPEKSDSIPHIGDLEKSPSGHSISQRSKRKKTDYKCDQNSKEYNSIFNDTKEFIKQLMNNQEGKINDILTTLKEMQICFTNLQNNISILTEENNTLKRRIDLLEIQNKQDGEYVTMLENNYEDQQRISRKCNIEIKNICLKKEETKTDIINMIYLLGENLKLKIDKQDVKDIIKIKTKNNKHTIIVEFNTTQMKNDMLKSAKLYNYKNKNNKLSAKHLGLKSNPDEPIFLSENLTAKSSRLFFLARDLKKVKNYKYCWTNYGKIYIRQDYKSPIISITSEGQVQKLISK